MSDDDVQRSNLSLEEQAAAAREIYEGTHGMTLRDLSEMTGIPLRVIQRFKRDQDWRKKTTTRPGEVSESVSEVAKIMTEQRGQPATPSKEDEETAQLILAPLPSEVNEILARHRKEWGVSRAMAAEAVRLRDVDPLKSFERAKLAKITAETMKLVQEGERKAHGLEAADKAASVVVIDRGE